MKPLMIVLATLASPALADKVSLSFGATHVGASEYNFNSEISGLFYTKEEALGDFDLTLGVYKNSYYNTSYAAFVSYDILEWSNGSLGLFGGVAHYPEYGRYQQNHIGGGWLALGGVQIQQGNLFAQILPGDGKEIDYIATIGLTFNID